jgi:hypothetical protein
MDASAFEQSSEVEIDLFIEHPAQEGLHQLYTPPKQGATPFIIGKYRSAATLQFFRLLMIACRLGATNGSWMVALELFHSFVKNLLDLVELRRVFPRCLNSLLCPCNQFSGFL